MDNSQIGPQPARYRWGPDRRLTWLTVGMLVIGSAWLVFDDNRENRVVAAVIALVGAAVTIVLLRVRVRLSADISGVTIRGPLHSRRASWAEIALIRVEMRGRFGRRSASLELEIDDEARGELMTGPAASGNAPEPRETTLIVFGSVELGADPAEVGRTLKALRR